MDIAEEAKRFMQDKKKPAKYSKEEYRQAFRSYFIGLVSGRSFYSVEDMWKEAMPVAKQLVEIEREELEWPIL